MWLETPASPAVEEASETFDAPLGDTGDASTAPEVPVLMVCDAPPDAFLMAEATIHADAGITTDPPIQEEPTPRLLAFAVAPEAFEAGAEGSGNHTEDSDPAGSVDEGAGRPEGDGGSGELQLCYFGWDNGLDDPSAGDADDQQAISWMEGSEDGASSTEEKPWLLGATFDATGWIDENQDGGDPEVVACFETIPEDGWIGTTTAVDDNGSQMPEGEGSSAEPERCFSDADNGLDDSSTGAMEDPQPYAWVEGAEDDTWGTEKEPWLLGATFDDTGWIDDNQDLTEEQFDGGEDAAAGDPDDDSVVATSDEGNNAEDDGLGVRDDSTGTEPVEKGPGRGYPGRIYGEGWPRYTWRGLVTPVAATDSSEDSSAEPEPTPVEQPLGGINWNEGIAYATTGAVNMAESDPGEGAPNEGDPILMPVPTGLTGGLGDEVPGWTSDTPGTPDTTTVTDSDGSNGGSDGEAEDPIAWTLDSPGNDPGSDPVDPFTGWERGSGTPLPWARGGQVEKATGAAVGSAPSSSQIVAPPATADDGSHWSTFFRSISASGAPGAAVASATGERDWLTGSGDGGTRFRWSSQSQSLLGRRGARTWDVVDGFNGDLDTLEAPDNITTRTIQSISGHTKRVRRSQIRSALDGKDFAPNTAAAFTNDRFDGTFVVFNDSQAGFQAKQDSIVFLRHYDFTPVDLF